MNPDFQTYEPPSLEPAEIDPPLVESPDNEFVLVRGPVKVSIEFSDGDPRKTPEIQAPASEPGTSETSNVTPLFQNQTSRALDEFDDKGVLDMVVNEIQEAA